MFTTLTQEEQLDKLVKTFWMDESSPEDDDLSSSIKDDLIAQKIKDSLVVLPNGQLEMPCLWKDGRPKLPYNFNYAKIRLFS